MRRVICDIFLIITTITTPAPEPADVVEEPATDLVTARCYTTPHFAADNARPWIIYQERILVHCQRDPVGDQIGIDYSQIRLP